LAKYDWWVDHKLSESSTSFQDFEERKALAKEWDAYTTPRVEFMYSYMDYDNDRYDVRKRFASHINKKTSLEDVGRMLDRIVLDSKARIGDYFRPEHHLLEQPDAAVQDLTSDDLNWDQTFLTKVESNVPHWMDTEQVANELDPTDREVLKEVYEEVKFKD